MARKARACWEGELDHLPDLLRADGAWVYYEVPAENFFILTWMIDADKAAEKVASLKDEKASLACIVDLFAGVAPRLIHHQTRERGTAP